MTIAIKSTIVLSALAVFLGLAVASPAASAFADQANNWTDDIDKEDAELGDYFGWYFDGGQKDTRSGGRFGGCADVARPAGIGEKDVQPGRRLHGRGQVIRAIPACLPGCAEKIPGRGLRDRGQVLRGITSSGCPR